jgi:hypothetical protein
MNDAPHDYGNGRDPQLVPSTLRVYRHFRIDQGERLAPMSVQPARYQYPVATRYTAQCLRDAYGSSPHEAPHFSCACGFYASYRPTEDFYPGELWRRAPDDPRSFHLTPIATAVCEVSGRVVMGTKGVRAQYMEIKALALDTSKYRMADLVGGQSSQKYRHDLTWGRMAVTAAAQRHGAVYWPTAKGMREAHPPPDISHLLPQTESRLRAMVTDLLRATSEATPGIRGGKWLRFLGG